MARIVLGLGTSHTPLFTLDASEWRHRAEADISNPALTTSDGRFLSYPELLAEVGPRYEEASRPEQLQLKWNACEAQLDHLGQVLEEAAPDIVVIVGDDQGELFDPSNRPAFAISHAAEPLTSDKYGHDEVPAHWRKVGRGYMMDARHALVGAPAFALDVITGLVDKGIDVATVSRVAGDRGAGLGHAFGFVVQRLFRGRQIPMVPVLLNTYYPPNVPTAARCHDMGKALREVIHALPGNERVAVVASGGLSHFIVDEALDRGIMAAFNGVDPDLLRRIPRCALNSGSSEILNWVMTAGAVDHLPVESATYIPIQRTPAGTGIGSGFVVWRD